MKKNTPIGAVVLTTVLLWQCIRLSLEPQRLSLFQGNKAEMNNGEQNMRGTFKQ